MYMRNNVTLQEGRTVVLGLVFTDLTVLSSPMVRFSLSSIGINRFSLVGLVGFFCVLFWKTRFQLVLLINFFLETGLKPGWNIWKSTCMILWRDWSSCLDYSQEFPHFNQKWLRKCFVEKDQQTGDPNKTWS